MATQQFTPEQYQAAIIELMEFVVAELDPEPAAQWAAYVATPSSIRLLAHVQIDHVLAGLSREPIRVLP